MIYDCFLYHGEDDLLDIRLNELNEYIDVFVIIENACSVSGIKDGYRFNPEKFINFSDKIRYIKIKDGLEKYKDQERTDSIEEEHWQREFYNRNSIMKGLDNASPDDIILISDLDEIPNLKDIDISYDLFIFKQICFQFKLNFVNVGLTPFYGTKGVKFKYLSSPNELRWYDQTMQYITCYDNLNKQTVQNGGWHFSFCLSIDAILDKLTSYAHHDRNKEFSIERDYIEKCIFDQTDIWNGKFHFQKRTNNLVKINLTKLPKYVQDNLNKFIDNKLIIE